MTDATNGKSDPGVTPKRSRRWPLVLSAILLSLLGVILLLPYGMNWKFQRWLEEQGLEQVRLENVDFNPFLLRLSFDGLHGVRPGTEDRLEIGQGVLDLAWGAFWQRRIRVERVAMRDAVITVNLPEGAPPRIGGLGPEKAPEPESPQQETSPWLWGCEEIELDNVQIRYRDPRGDAPLSIVHARLENLGTLTPGKSTSFQIQLAKTEGNVLLDGISKPFADQASLSLSLKIADLGLAWTSPFLGAGLADFDGTLSTPESVQITFRQTGEGPRVEVQGPLSLRQATVSGEGFRLQPLDLAWDGNFLWEGSRWLADGRFTAGGGGVVLEGADLSILLDRLEFAGEVGSAAGEPEEESGLQLAGEGSVSGLVLDQEGRGNLLEVATLTLADLGWENPQTLTAAQVTVKGLKLFERRAGAAGEKGGFSHFLLLRQADLAAARLSAWRELRGASLQASGLEGLLAWEEDGTLSLSHWFEGPAETEPETAAEEESAAEAGQDGGFACSIGRVEIGDGSRLVMEDHRVDPPFLFAMEPFRATLAPLEMIETSQPGRLDLEAKPGEYAALTAEGTVRPFADPLSLDIEGELKALNLAKLTPYAQMHLGYRLKSGHLYVDYAAEVDKGRLDGELKIMASKLELEDAPSEAEAKVREELGVPLPKALSMIKDGDGNIRLTLDLSGEVEDPDFQLSGIISAALIKALKTGIVSYYAPLGVTLLTGASLPLGATFLATKLFKMATTLRFDPVVFEPLEAGLGDRHQERMETLAGLLEDRPDVRLAICGVATGADLAGLRRTGQEAAAGAAAAAEEEETAEDSAPEQTSGGGAAEPTPPPTPEERDRLLALAEGRAAAIKSFLVERGIEAGRLFLCSPEIQLEEGLQPRVELAI